MMDFNRFTEELYGRDFFKYSTDRMKLPDGFVEYHKRNFSAYFGLSVEHFKGKKVLETGCGPGKHAVVLALMGADVTAVDLTAENITKGNQLKDYYGLENIQFIRHDLMKPMEGEAVYDMISAHNWLQHAENPSIVLGNIVSKLREGGFLYLSLYHGLTFRFFIAHIARSILSTEDYPIIKKMIRSHFPQGFKEFDNPDDIYMENILDDFFVPFCHTTTYKRVIEELKRLGLEPITEIPELRDVSGLDNIPLRVGCMKKRDSAAETGLFTSPVDEFKERSHDIVCKSAERGREIISLFANENNPYLKASFCLGLYRIRASTCKIDDIESKYNLLSRYMDGFMADTLVDLSSYYDTQTLYLS